MVDVGASYIAKGYLEPLAPPNINIKIARKMMDLSRDAWILRKTCRRLRSPKGTRIYMKIVGLFWLLTQRGWSIPLSHREWRASFEERTYTD